MIARLRARGQISRHWSRSAHKRGATHGLDSYFRAFRPFSFRIAMLGGLGMATMLSSIDASVMQSPGNYTESPDRAPAASWIVRWVRHSVWRVF